MSSDKRRFSRSPPADNSRSRSALSVARVAHQRGSSGEFLRFSSSMNESFRKMFSAVSRNGIVKLPRRELLDGFDSVEFD